MKIFKRFFGILNTIYEGYRVIHRMDSKYILISFLKSFTSALVVPVSMYYSAQIVNTLSADWRDLKIITIYILQFIFLTLLLKVVNGILRYYKNTTDECLYTNYRLLLSQKYLKLSYKQMNSAAVGEKYARLEEIALSFGGGLPRLAYKLDEIAETITAIVSSIVLLAGFFDSEKEILHNSFITSKLAAVIMLFICVACMWGSSILRKNNEKEQQEIMNELPENIMISNYYEDYIRPENGGKYVRLYNQSQQITEILHDRFIKKNIINRLCKKTGSQSAIVQSSEWFIEAILYVFICMRAFLGMYQLGNLFQYIGAAAQLLKSFGRLAKIYIQLECNNAYVQDVLEYMKLPEEERKGEKCEPGELVLEVNNVSFRYPGSNSYALRNVSMKLEHSCMAVVGENGSGKTTLIKLLCRLYEPTEGEILLNGKNINMYDMESYWKILSTVFQDFTLFSIPIGENIACLDKYDSKTVDSILQKNRIHNEAYPKGLNTILFKNYDGNGVDISGGEAQKIAISRAVYKDSSLLIMDEPTAALDPMAEEQIFQQIYALSKEKKTIFVSHRLSSCRFCDYIFVFDKGQLIQEGSHKELLKDTEGKYYELWSVQAGYYQ